MPHYEWDRLEKLGMVVAKKPEIVYRLSKGWEEHEFHAQPEPGVEINFVKEPGKPGEYIEAYTGRIRVSTFCIKYNPVGEASRGWGESADRVNRISWRIKQDDRFILNYDKISIDDIDFYLNSRVDRPAYYTLMPLLFHIKKRLLEEKADEEAFVKLLVGLVLAKMPEVSVQKAESFSNELIEWWKYRTIQKRPIAKDDTLAMRMIERRLNAAVNKKKLVVPAKENLED